MMPRITIARLIAAIGFIGVCLAALRFATDWWASVVFTSTLLALALAATYAAQRRGPRRAFWSAFVAFGVAYMVLAFGPWCETAIRPRLATSKLLDTLFPLLHPTADTAVLHPSTDTAVRVWDAATGKPVRGVSFSPDGRVVGWNRKAASPQGPAHGHFQDIGHSLWALLLAAIGGTVSGYFYANRDERRREAAEKAAGVLLRVLEAGL